MPDVSPVTAFVKIPVVVVHSGIQFTSVVVNVGSAVVLTHTPRAVILSGEPSDVTFAQRVAHVAVIALDVGVVTVGLLIKRGLEALPGRLFSYSFFAMMRNIYFFSLVKDAIGIKTGVLISVEVNHFGALTGGLVALSGTYGIH